MRRDTLIKNLQKNLMQITFTKVNGEERKMDCTLNESLLPETFNNNKEETHKTNKEVLPVWDVNKNAWRSFRLDSITNITKLEAVDDSYPDYSSRWNR